MTLPFQPFKDIFGEDEIEDYRPEEEGEEDCSNFVGPQGPQNSESKSQESSAEEVQIASFEDTSFDPTYKRMNEVDAYGPTVKLQFQKEMLEKTYKLDKSPDLCTKKILCWVIVTEIVLFGFLACLVFGFLGAKLEYKASQVLNMNSTDVENFEKLLSASGFQKNEVLAKAVFEHAFSFSMSFSFLIPQVFLFKIILSRMNVNTRSVVDTITKVLAISCAFYGMSTTISMKHTIESNGSHGSRDCGIHKSTAYLASLFIFFYLGLLVLKLVGLLVPRVYKIRVIGIVLRYLSHSSQFSSGLIHLANFLGLLGNISGMHSYVLLTRGNHFDGKIDNLLSFGDFEKVSAYKRMFIVLSICSLIYLHILIEVGVSARHWRRYHSHCLTFKQFSEGGFARFSKIYQPEDIKRMGEPKPKVNTALRRL